MINEYFIEITSKINNVGVFENNCVKKKKKSSIK